MATARPTSHKEIDFLSSTEFTTLSNAPELSIVVALRNIDTESLPPEIASETCNLHKTIRTISMRIDTIINPQSTIPALVNIFEKCGLFETKRTGFQKQLLNLTETFTDSAKADRPKDMRHLAMDAPKISSEWDNGRILLAKRIIV